MSSTRRTKSPLTDPDMFYRIDKYYMLVRRFVNASFRLLIRTQWDDKVCAEYNSILTDKGGPLW